MHIARSIIRNGARLKFVPMKILPTTNQQPTPRNLQQDPLERTPKPEYPLALAIYLGVRWKGPIQFLMDQYLCWKGRVTNYQK